MKKLGKNKVLLEGDVILKYDTRLNSVSLTSKDPDIQGELFKVYVPSGSRSDTSIRKVMKNKGIEEISSLPLSPIPVENFLSATMIPLGVSVEKTLYWDTDKKDILLIGGSPGSGKTIMHFSIAEYASKSGGAMPIHYISSNEERMYYNLSEQKSEYEIIDSIYEDIHQGFKPIAMVDSVRWMGDGADLFLNLLASLAFRKKILLVISESTLFDVSSKSFISTGKKIVESDQSQIVHMGEVTTERHKSLFNFIGNENDLISSLSRRVPSGSGYFLENNDPIYFKAFTPHLTKDDLVSQRIALPL